MEINILHSFTEYPGLRHCSISDNSGEEFYHLILNKSFYDSLNKNEKLYVDLDNTGGFASSFLDEAFGNLVYDFTLEKVKNIVEIISIEEPHWKEMIFEKTFLEWESRRKEKIKPVVTKIHEPWYRIEDNNIVSKIWEYPSVAT